MTRVGDWIIRRTEADGPSDRAVATALVELAKPGITKMVGLTAGFGFAAGMLGGAGRAALHPARASDIAVALAACVVGTALSSAGANALNQWWEAPRDARMERTRNRPVPSGRVDSATACSWGLFLSVLGAVVLGLGAGPAAALLAMATVVTYVFVYTPSKPRTVWNTLIGAVPGAVPPMIGTASAAWVAGEKGLGALGDPMGWALLGLLAAWQIPHFLSIAWRYRQDYARGGFRMLPSVGGPGGWGERATGPVALAGALVLMAASVVPGLVSATAASDAGVVSGVRWVYVIAAVISGAVYCGLCARLMVRRTDGAARGVFVASIVHLPVLMLALVADLAGGVLVG
jgi:protoheme IX farnesyltransferase